MAAAVAIMLVRAHFAPHLTGFFLTAAPGLLAWRRELTGGGAFKLIVAVGTLGGPVFALGVWAAVGFVFLWARLRGREAAEVASSPWICIGTAIAAGLCLALGDVGPWV
ncbi:MAG: hypothetical protein HYZ29_05615 [Myxococcales bacterium]|nr:hypothetical protein [Myxococcales bacterium]